MDIKGKILHVSESNRWNFQPIKINNPTTSITSDSWSNTAVQASSVKKGSIVLHKTKELVIKHLTNWTSLFITSPAAALLGFKNTPINIHLFVVFSVLFNLGE